MINARPILEVTGQSFRRAIAPSLVGQLASMETRIAPQAAVALQQWLYRVIDETMRTTRLKDRNGIVYRALMKGAKVTGGANLAALRGRIDADPWIFAQEHGAEIKPKNGSKYLAIPLFYALRGDGTPKYRNASSWKRWGSFVYTQKATGKKFLAYKSASGELRILYLLIEKVELKPILGLTKTSLKLVGQLVSAWGSIYVNEAVAAGGITLWGARSANE